MSDDITVNPVGIPTVATLAKKPPHLVSLTDGKRTQLFLSLDKPESLNGFIQVKGFFIDSGTETDVMKNYIELLSTVSKESYADMLFPIHRVLSIRNLIFKAK